MANKQYVAVIDCGSQTTRLIARMIRQMGVLARVVPLDISQQRLREDPPIALILSGGPASLLDSDSPRPDPLIFSMKIPILGICYGMQLIVENFGGSIERALARELGKRSLVIDPKSCLFDGLPSTIKAWMSHADQVTLPAGFSNIGESNSCPHAAIECKEKNIWAVQFHPEVSHSEFGEKIIRNFIFDIAQAQAQFDEEDWESRIKNIAEEVGDARVILGLSGGVDSMVSALLIHRAIKGQLFCIYVNHGLHRLGEIEEIKLLFKKLFSSDLIVVDAQEQFFIALREESDPELKRKIIGKIFVDVFEKEASRIGEIKYLAQGTLYSDVIESKGDDNGHSHVIKTHHNVGGLPKNMNLKLLEPLRDLFKDEVRKLGSWLGIADDILWRQPFPGPGLAIRILGAVTAKRVHTLQKADAIVREEIEHAQKNGLILDPLWQWFAVLLPIKSVGLVGDARSYLETIAIRSVTSRDAMTADWAKIPFEILGTISSRISNEVDGISRVVYDITQKPPGTIEWE